MGLIYTESKEKKSILIPLLYLGCAYIVQIFFLGWLYFIHITKQTVNPILFMMGLPPLGIFMTILLSLPFLFLTWPYRILNKRTILTASILGLCLYPLVYLVVFLTLFLYGEVIEDVNICESLGIIGIFLPSLVSGYIYRQISKK